ncbi:MAG: hypothetical protein KIC46_08795, partial [Clostridiales bacterium]|nr:hypothetical protein [Clostridiales bacterium]
DPVSFLIARSVTSTSHASFLSLSIHEPRRKILRALPWPPESAQRRIKMPVTKAIKSHAFCALFSALRRYRQAAFYRYLFS